ncbi:hypothetical protein [Streptomyces shenzhenensis]|uniref:hypothetical protein n=1 Tax=Streptomyces shenzhenensis TaxID=943815 RepID=UPI00367C57CC
MGSNIHKLAEFTLTRTDPDYPRRAADPATTSSSEGRATARAPLPRARRLGLRAVVAKSYARIHWQSLTNFGVLPGDYDRIDTGDRYGWRTSTPPRARPIRSATASPTAAGTPCSPAAPGRSLHTVRP